MLAACGMWQVVACGIWRIACKQNTFIYLFANCNGNRKTLHYFNAHHMRCRRLDSWDTAHAALGRSCAARHAYWKQLNFFYFTSGLLKYVVRIIAFCVCMYRTTINATTPTNCFRKVSKTNKIILKHTWIFVGPQTVVWR